LLVRQIKWELVLLLFVLLLSMIPTAGLFSVEFSLAAVFSFGSRGLCGRSVAPATGVTDRGYSGTRSHCRYGQCDANSAYHWLARFPVDMDLSWARGVLVSLGDRAARF